MKPTMLVVVLVAAASACTSVPGVKGPFARATHGVATQTDAGPDTAVQAEPSPFPVQTPFGN
jgi:hypothetical protein